MARKQEPEPQKLAFTESMIVTRQRNAAGFTVEADRSDDKPVSQLRLRRHGHVEFPCRSCEKPNRVPALSLDRADLDKLIELLTQVRDEMVPALEKFGIEE